MQHSFVDACLIRYVETHHRQFRRRDREEPKDTSLIPEAADLTKLTNAELEFLERVLVKLEGEPSDSV